MKFVQKNNALTLTADMTGLGGQGSGLLAALLGSRPHGAATLNWLPDGRLLMKSLAVDGPGLKVTGVNPEEAVAESRIVPRVAE